MKRFCKSAHCDTKTLHNATFSDEGAKIWKCQNCGLETPRFNRKSAKQKAIDSAYELLLSNHKHLEPNV